MNESFSRAFKRIIGTIGPKKINAGQLSAVWISVELLLPL